MKRLYAPNEFFRIRGLREGMRAGDGRLRPLSDVLRDDTTISFPPPPPAPAPPRKPN